MAKRSKYKMTYVQRKNGDVVEDSAGFFRAFFPNDVSEVFTGNLEYDTLYVSTVNP